MALLRKVLIRTQRSLPNLKWKWVHPLQPINDEHHPVKFGRRKRRILYTQNHDQRMVSDSCLRV